MEILVCWGFVSRKCIGMYLRTRFIVSSVIQSKLIYVYGFLTEMKDLKIKLYLILKKEKKRHTINQAALFCEAV